MGNALVFDNARSTLSAMGFEIAARGGFGFGPHDYPHTEAQDNSPSVTLSSSGAKQALFALKISHVNPPNRWKFGLTEKLF